MSVKCERNCKSKDCKGVCQISQLVINADGKCVCFKPAPEYEPIRADNVVIFDKAGIPSIMVRFSRVTDKELFDGSDKVFPAFIIGGQVYDEIYISKYPNTIINGKAYSLPYQKPATNVTYTDAEEACFSKGEGWHLWTAAERGLLANICKKNDVFPHGNTNYGKWHGDEKEKGETYGYGRTLTGTGPATWNHDYTVFGVSDLCGNIYEWFRGLRLMNGVLQAPENNDAAMDIDLSEDSDKWKPLLADNGKIIRMDCTDGDVRFTTDEDISEDYNGCEWQDVVMDIEVTEQMKELALYPGEPNAYLYVDTEGERLPLCGGRWAYAAGAGVFGVDLHAARSNSHDLIGFRSAFYRKLDTEN